MPRPRIDRRHAELLNHRRERELQTGGVYHGPFGDATLTPATDSELCSSINTGGIEETLVGSVGPFRRTPVINKDAAATADRKLKVRSSPISVISTSKSLAAESPNPCFLLLVPSTSKISVRSSVTPSAAQQMRSSQPIPAEQSPVTLW